MLRHLRSLNLQFNARHFSAATPAAHMVKVNGNTAKRYVPPTANGQYLIEQKNEQWSSCVAAMDLKPGQVIGKAPGVFHSKPNRFTVQADTDKHLLFAGGLEYVNHSCDPNARIVISPHEPEVIFVAHTHIHAGEHITFDYATSEWDMEEQFICQCGAHNCRQHIGGAKYLTSDQVQKSLSLFTPSILRLLLARKMVH